MVEYHLAKVDVEGSSPFARSIFQKSPKKIVKAFELFKLPNNLPFEKVFLPSLSPWEWVGLIAEALKHHKFDKTKTHKKVPPQFFIEGDVFIHPSVILPPYGYIKGPVYVGAQTELRVGVFIRGNVIVGEKCTLGNSCEYKNCLLMDKVQTPHFNYIGDSILGTGAHLAAGAITANVRLDRKTVSLKIKGQKIKTNYKKLGSLIGEYAEVGCNSVLQPGTILGKKAMVGPCVACGGFLEASKRIFALAPIEC